MYTLVYYRSPEVQVMDYQAQQFKLLPLIASAYALILTGRYMLRVHMESRAEIADGNLESLPEVGGSPYCIVTIFLYCSSIIFVVSLPP